MQNTLENKAKLTINKINNKYKAIMEIRTLEKNDFINNKKTINSIKINNYLTYVANILKISIDEINEKYTNIFLSEIKNSLFIYTFTVSCFYDLQIAKIIYKNLSEITKIIIRNVESTSTDYTNSDIFNKIEELKNKAKENKHMITEFTKNIEFKSLQVGGKKSKTSKKKHFITDGNTLSEIFMEDKKLKKKSKKSNKSK